MQAFTLDFWNTLVVANTNGAGRVHARMTHLHQVACSCRPELEATPEVVERAYRKAADDFDAVWRREHFTPTTSDLIRYIWRELGVSIEDQAHAGAVSIFEECLLDSPPDLTEGIADALAFLSERYPLAIISDTMFTPGRVLRRFLERHGLLRYFTAFVFSDEAGFSKPDRRAFEAAAAGMGVPVSECVHVGDLRRTDIGGALAVGAVPIRYTGAYDDPEAGPEAPYVMSHWQELPGLVARIDRDLSAKR